MTTTPPAAEGVVFCLRRFFGCGFAPVTIGTTSLSWSWPLQPDFPKKPCGAYDKMQRASISSMAFVNEQPISVNESTIIRSAEAPVWAAPPMPLPQALCGRPPPQASVPAAPPRYPLPEASSAGDMSTSQGETYVYMYIHTDTYIHICLYIFMKWNTRQTAKDTKNIPLWQPHPQIQGVCFHSDTVYQEDVSPTSANESTIMQPDHT